MPLTRSFRETVAKRARNDAAFRAALVEEAVQNILDGDVETALGQLRDVVNATMGFDALAAATGRAQDQPDAHVGSARQPAC